MVKNGDNLWTIAKRHRTTLGELRKCNDTLRRHTIFPGQKLILSCADNNNNNNNDNNEETASNTKNKVHIVRHGESLWSIAKKYNTTITKITSINNLRRNSKIFAGRKIMVPNDEG